MIGSTFLAGCSTVIYAIELLVSAAVVPTVRTASQPTRPVKSDFFTLRTDSARAEKRKTMIEPVDNDCPPSPLVSDSSSVDSDSSSDISDSDTESDVSIPSRSRAYGTKIAAVDLWISRQPNSTSLDLIAATRDFGFCLVDSEEGYELGYDASRDCVKTSEFAESEEARDERITDRVLRAMDGFAALRRVETPRQRLVARELAYASRPYTWPAQTHSRSVSTVEGHFVDLRSIRRDLASPTALLSTSRHETLARRSPPGCAKTKPDALRRQLLNQAVRPAYIAHKRQQRIARATARIASTTVDRRTGSKPFPSSTPRRPSAALPARPRSQIPIAAARPIGPAPVPSSASAASQDAPRRAKKSYGEIQPRRAPWRV